LVAILKLSFPFELKSDQQDAVDAWLENRFKGSIIYSTGTGKTEIAFECARRLAEIKHNNESVSSSKYSPDRKANNEFRILFVVPRIVLIEQNVNRLIRYGLPRESVGTFFGEQKEIKEITISTYQSVINHLELIRNSNMIILDEIHLLVKQPRNLRRYLT